MWSATLSRWRQSITLCLQKARLPVWRESTRAAVGLTLHCCSMNSSPSTKFCTIKLPSFMTHLTSCTVWCFLCAFQKSVWESGETAPFNYSLRHKWGEWSNLGPNLLPSEKLSLIPTKWEDAWALAPFWTLWRRDKSLAPNGNWATSPRTFNLWPISNIDHGIPNYITWSTSCIRQKLDECSTTNINSVYAWFTYREGLIWIVYFISYH